MSRDIKFRCWDKEKSEMLINGVELELRKLGMPPPKKAKEYIGFNEDERFTHMQSTGLKDKSFDEVGIYEGDVLGNSRQDELEAVGQVIFDIDLAQFTIQYTNGGWAELWQHLAEKTNEGREIIGNIYENPELLPKPNIHKED